MSETKAPKELTLVDLAEQTHMAIQSIFEALRQVNEEKDYEISECLEEIEDSLKTIEKMF